MRLEVALVRVKPGTWESEKIETLKYCVLYIDKENLDKVSNELVKDVFMAKPGYHRYPGVSFEKVYDEKTVQEVLEMINRGKIEYYCSIEY